MQYSKLLATKKKGKRTSTDCGIYSVCIPNYPFGLNLEIASADPTVANNIKFNSKELQHNEFTDAHGNKTSLQWEDYGARMQDPQLGRWNGIDEKAEKYLSLSPYNFAANNPVSNIDKDGKDPFKALMNAVLNQLGARGNDEASTKAWTKEVLVPAAEKAAEEALPAILMMMPGLEEIGVAEEAGIATFAVDATSVETTVVESEEIIEEGAIANNGVAQSKKAAQLIINKANSKTAETAVKNELLFDLEDGQTLLEQPSFKLESGGRARPDFAIVNEEGDIVKTVDAKSGNAQLSKNQKDLQQNGGTLTGKKFKDLNGTKAEPGTLEVKNK